MCPIYKRKVTIGILFPKSILPGCRLTEHFPDFPKQWPGGQVVRIRGFWQPSNNSIANNADSWLEMYLYSFWWLTDIFCHLKLLKIPFPYFPGEKAHDAPYEVNITIPVEGYEVIQFTLTKMCGR